jgi:hypothetical protein
LSQVHVCAQHKRLGFIPIASIDGIVTLVYFFILVYYLIIWVCCRPNILWYDNRLHDYLIISFVCTIMFVSYYTLIYTIIFNFVTHVIRVVSLLYFSYVILLFDLIIS